MTKLDKDLEEELEARLQMIPHHLDRRKFRGLIQRIRTQTEKKAKEEGRREVAEKVENLCKPLRPIIAEDDTVVSGHNKGLLRLLNYVNQILKEVNK